MIKRQTISVMHLIWEPQHIVCTIFQPEVGLLCLLQMSLQASSGLWYSNCSPSSLESWLVCQNSSMSHIICETHCTGFQSRTKLDSRSSSLGEQQWLPQSTPQSFVLLSNLVNDHPICTPLERVGPPLTNYNQNTSCFLLQWTVIPRRWLIHRGIKLQCQEHAKGQPSGVFITKCTTLGKCLSRRLVTDAPTSVENHSVW